MSGMFLFAVMISGCTTSAWMAGTEPVQDPDSEEVLSEQMFFQPVVTPEAQNPTLSLDLVNRRTLRYNRNLVSSRFIQRYRPRYTYLSFGLAGMGMGLYLANSSVVGADRLSDQEQAMLNLAALGIGTASLMSMKPIGEPRPTGEQQIIKRADSYIHYDTIPAALSSDAEVQLSITRGAESLVSDKPIPLTDNRVSVHLGQESGIRQLSEHDTTSLKVHFRYQQISYEQTYQLTDFMYEFVEITESNVPVRTAPANLNNNIISHVGTESRFPFLSEIDDNWYRVMKNGTAAYIRKDEARKIWQIADQTDINDLVISPDQPVFGDIEIERNLPDHSRTNPEGIAIIIINGEYRQPVRNLPNASRTGALAALYLNRVLGYYSDNIRVFENMTAREMERLLQESDSLMIGGRYLSLDESDLFFYYYGHAFTDADDRLYLLPVDYDPAEINERTIPFDEITTTLENIRSRQLVMVMDTDLSRGSVFGQTDEPTARLSGDSLDKLSDSITSRSDTSVVFWAAQPGQHAETYAVNNGRNSYPYDIFTWYYFRALQEGAQSVAEIEQYLQRNVPFTSRRLHDRAQNSRVYGNRDILLVRD